MLDSNCSFFYVELYGDIHKVLFCSSFVCWIMMRYCGIYIEFIVYCLLFTITYFLPGILLLFPSILTIFTNKLVYYNFSILNFKHYTSIKCYLNLKKCLLPCFCSVSFGKNSTSFMNTMKQNILWHIHALCSNCLLFPVLAPQSGLFGYIDLWI